jgi:hypothetical protein
MDRTVGRAARIVLCLLSATVAGCGGSSAATSHASSEAVTHPTASAKTNTPADPRWAEMKQCFDAYQLRIAKTGSRPRLLVVGGVGLVAYGHTGRRISASGAGPASYSKRGSISFHGFLASVPAVSLGPVSYGLIASSRSAAAHAFKGCLVRSFGA